MTPEPTFECFRDTSYYDMWCVRPIANREFGQGFHVVRQEEAERLRDVLNLALETVADLREYVDGGIPDDDTSDLLMRLYASLGVK
ncbi:hypothetical protein [Sphingomonas sp. TREG-RG-20F-R18-01]|uniref:hypothetical protein n=1 Tax=Sphingomonas sp. TREG-RG-20F-R18-01 TaxID=2914982 RepID=UPI001F597413|nr:hypothetical protein [Sphingomonas sp. TREG-RG-20F-R18-01]